MSRAGRSLVVLGGFAILGCGRVEADAANGADVGAPNDDAHDPALDANRDAEIDADASVFDDAGTRSRAIWAHQAHGGLSGRPRLSLSPVDDAIAVSGAFEKACDYDGPSLAAMAGSEFDSRYLFVLEPKGTVRWSRTMPAFLPEATWTTKGALAFAGGLAGSWNTGAGTLVGGGKLENDPVVAAYASDGTSLWSRNYHVDAPGVRDAAITAIAAGPAGQIVVGATVAGAVDFGTGPIRHVTAATDAGLATSHAALLALLDESGTAVWVRQVHSLIDTANVEHVAVSPSGAIAVAGLSNDARGTFPFEYVEVYRPDGLPVGSGGVSSWPDTKSDARIFAMRWTSAESLVAVVQLHGRIDFGTGPLVASAAGAVVRVTYQNDGSCLDARILVDGSLVEQHPAAIASDGSLVVTYTDDVSHAMLMTAFDASGTRTWQRRTTYDGLAVWGALAFDRAGALVATGSVDSPKPLDLGGPIVQGEPHDGFVAKLLP